MDGDRSPSSLLREAGKKAPDQLPAKPVLRHGCELCSSPLRYLCLLVLITHHAFDFFGGFSTLFSELWWLSVAVSWGFQHCLAGEGVLMGKK